MTTQKNRVYDLGVIYDNHKQLVNKLCWFTANYDDISEWVWLYG